MMEGMTDSDFGWVYPSLVCGGGVRKADGGVLVYLCTPPLIPAKAGMQIRTQLLDSRLRGNKRSLFPPTLPSPGRGLGRCTA
jgi:hypothetical protein